MSFFDMPAGYSDADLEMSELEAEGNRRYRLLKWATPEQRAELEAGGVIHQTRVIKATGGRYDVLVRLDVDAYELAYSVAAHAGWHPTAKAARLAYEGA